MIEKPRTYPRQVPWLADELAQYLKGHSLHLHRGVGSLGRIVWYMVYDTPDAHMRVCGTNRCYKA